MKKFATWLRSLSKIQHFMVNFILLNLITIPGAKLELMPVMLLINCFFARLNMGIQKVWLTNSKFMEDSMALLKILEVAKTVDEHFECRTIFKNIVEELSKT